MSRVISTICFPRDVQRDEPSCIIHPTSNSTIMIGQKMKTGRMSGIFWSYLQRTTAIDVIDRVVLLRLQTRLVRLL